MENPKEFYVVLTIEVPLIEGWQGEHPDSPCGFMPVFESKAAALAHAGGVFAVHAIRLAAPQASQEPVGGSPHGR